jgi:hypothetical protein
MTESKTVAITTGVVGSVLAAAIGAWLGIGAGNPPGVTIQGPSLTTVEEPITLTGHVNGDVRSAYWTDEIGYNEPMSGSDGDLSWYCLGPGSFRVSLIAVMADNSQYQATHQIQCV